MIYIPKCMCLNRRWLKAQFLGRCYLMYIFARFTNLLNEKVLRIKALQMTTKYMHHLHLLTNRRVARNSQRGGCFGGLGAKPPAAGGWGFGGKAPSRRRHGGLGTEPPALEKFAFFCKNNFILGLNWLKNNAFKTWLRNWQCKQD